jgi:(p)ppGpp synthase/HD superfamily hydrolase
MKKEICRKAFPERPAHSDPNHSNPVFLDNPAQQRIRSNEFSSIINSQVPPMPSDWSQDLYIEAYRFAAQAHWDKQQLVPGTNIPYLMHFSFVAMEVIAVLALESDLNGNVAVQCALLHDTLENTDVTYDQLKSVFGIWVADGVAALTKNESIGHDLPKPDKEKAQMAECLERIKRQPREMWIVKMAKYLRASRSRWE